MGLFVACPYLYLNHKYFFFHIYKASIWRGSSLKRVLCFTYLLTELWMFWVHIVLQLVLDAHKNDNTHTLTLSKNRLATSQETKKKNITAITNVDGCVGVAIVCYILSCIDVSCLSHCVFGLTSAYGLCYSQWLSSWWWHWVDQR